MDRILNLVLLLCLGLLVPTAWAADARSDSGATSSPGSNEKEWTILVYMNGKNDLETFVIDDFLEMASVGSSAKIDVVVQVGRMHLVGKYASKDDTRYGDWTGAKRFHVESNDEPTADTALMDLGKMKKSTDMGSKEGLKDFIRWGVKTFPAKRYAVVVWNHGQGWRLMSPGSATNRSSKTPTPGEALSSPVPNTFRSVSADFESRHIIYNVDVAGAIRESMEGKALDVLGFDACLMAMLESAYEFRDLGKVLVASEEVEPGTGWDYETILSGFAAKPSMDASEAAKLIVGSYEQQYAGRGKTTLSAFDLSSAKAIATDLDTLIGRIVAKGDAQAAKAARAPMLAYADASYIQSSVDLGAWLDNLQQHTKDPDLSMLASDLRKKLDGAIIANYASRTSKQYGSNGLAIFFPRSNEAFRNDPDYEGYVIANTHKPVSFVREHRWAAFLHDAFGLSTK
jgi:hypothetical protein